MGERTSDVVIIGGAAAGSAAAYFLTKGGFPGTVTIVEKDTSFQACASGRSVASVRQQFTTPENIELSAFGARFFKGIREELGPDADISFRERGYLIMATAEGRPVLEEAIRLQRSLGAATELLEPAEIARRFPWLSVQGLAAAGWGPRDEGWVDPNSLMTLLRNAARARGVGLLHDEVVGLDVAASRIARVKLKSGDTIEAGEVINTAGWHSHKVAAMAGIALPVRPRKRLVFVLDCRTPLPGAGLMIDPTGVYFRPEGQYYLAGVAPPEHEDPDCEDFDIDHAFFETHVWPALATRVPAFEAVKVVNAWACHYDHNTLDQNAIVGRHPEISNFILASGFSGHGLQHSPAIGRALAEIVMEGRSVSIDLARFGYERVLSGRPVAEKNVY